MNVDVVFGLGDGVRSGNALEECSELLVVAVGSFFANPEPGFSFADAGSGE
jgi:hypothetical protein